MVLVSPSLHTHDDGFSGLDHDSINVCIGLSALHRGSGRTLSKYMYLRGLASDPHPWNPSLDRADTRSLTKRDVHKLVLLRPPKTLRDLFIP